MTRSAVRNPLKIGFGAALIGLCGGCGWHAGCDCPSAPRLYPLGAVNHAHYEAMQANGQAVAFTVHQFEFIGATSELSPAGKETRTQRSTSTVAPASPRSCWTSVLATPSKERSSPQPTASD
jgi:hypothetical protein